jgi:tRNA (guanine-N7-)-methyltransferase
MLRSQLHKSTCTELSRFTHFQADMSEQTPQPHPHIRSFVRRQGKITAGQRHARERLAQEWTLAFSNQPLDLAQAFGNTNGLILEIGFGMGETTAEIARQNPDLNFLGVEVYPAGVGAMLNRIASGGLTNVRIIEHDAVEVLRDGLLADQLQGVHIYFPDPWPKKRHHKRRLIQAPFVQLLASRIMPGGYLHCATDWPEYADQMLQELSSCNLLKNQHAGFAPRPDWRPLTKFEARGLRLGHPVADLVFRRV